MHRSTHFMELLDRSVRTPRIEAMSKFIEENFRKVEPPTIVGIGLSGAIIACQIATRIDCNLCLVRKFTTSHTLMSIEAEEDFTKYVIVDDQIATGETIRNIRTKLGTRKCLGIVLFNVGKISCGYSHCGGINDVPVYWADKDLRFTRYE